MSEYTPHLETYVNYNHSSFSRLVPEQEWGNSEVAEQYLQKYWLSNEEYLHVWKPIQDQIFLEGHTFPDVVYASSFHIVALRGGCLFEQRDFEQLQSFMLQAGEDSFAVVQASQEFTQGQPMFRMKFPVNVTWDDLTKGNYISATLLEMPYNEYFVFGEKGHWGKYVATDYQFPLDIVGVDDDLVPLLYKTFKISLDEQQIVKSQLPQQYIPLIEWEKLKN